MVDSKELINLQYKYDNIQNALITQLDRVREQTPEQFSKQIHALSAITDNNAGQLKQALQQETKDHTGERIVLIPCLLKNSHWIGILIEFQTTGQVIRAEYIDPLAGSDVVSDTLQQEFREVYSNNVLLKKDLQKFHDLIASASLTIKNLLTAAGKVPILGDSAPGMSQIQNQHKYNDDTNRYFSDEKQPERPKKAEINLTSPRSISEERNQLTLQQLEQKLTTGLTKCCLQDRTELPGEIEETEKRIKKYEKQGRHKKAQEERESLQELQELYKISNRIVEVSSDMSTSHIGNASRISELEEELRCGLARFNMADTVELSEEIREIEKQIEKFEKQGRKEKAQEETEFLCELQELYKISTKIMELSSDKYVSHNKRAPSIPELEEKLRCGLARFNMTNTVELSEEIRETEKQIEKFKKQGRTGKAQEETVFLRELKELHQISEEICKLPSTTSVSDTNESFIQTTPAEPSIDDDTISSDQKNKKCLYLKDLRDDSLGMPSCAEKTIVTLLIYFEKKLLGDDTPLEDENSVLSLLQMLEDQLKKEELLSEEVRVIFQDLRVYISSTDFQSIVRCLDQLISKIRFLNIPEIQRLVSKAEKAGDLICDKEIILLVGGTGSGKSTTIQFLAGSQMKEIQFEIAPGKFLEHITTVGSVKNPGLMSVTSSPLNKSETRYIAPVTVQLKDIYGAHETGVITLCDAPGFGDTAGPEVDIANSVGVIEALKKSKSVKILALSSYKSLGDRGQGIQELAHILIRTIHGIEERLSSIFYAFTKYPETTNINAVLLDIKTSKIDTDPSLQFDSAFTTVLSDMITKTNNGALKIAPVQGNPKVLIEKLKRVNSIEYPQDVFRFSMSKETHAIILNQIQKDKLNIRCAIKHKDIDLVLYHLNHLKILEDLIKHSLIRDAYEDSICFVKESINEYYIEVTKTFSRALGSQDGLENKDISHYKVSIEYFERTQKLKEHLGTELMSPASLIQNIASKLKEIDSDLVEKDLYSPLVRTHLNNLHMLKNVFPELESTYMCSCKKFSERFQEIAQSVREPILANEFQSVAEIILNVHKCLAVFASHLDEQVEKKYRESIELILQHLSSFSVKADSVLAKIKLTNTDVETLKSYMDILRSAKENNALQDRISTYMNMLRNKRNNASSTSEENITNIDQICADFIAKIIKYFDDINTRIKELFDRSGDHAFEYIEELVNDMDAIRTIPEIESKTAGTYYRTVEYINSFIQQAKEATERLLHGLDQQSGTVNYRHIARTLSRLKTAEWINRVSPGAYDSVMRRITEDLLQYSSELETRLMKVDFTLKNPKNVNVAYDIVEKIELMSILERSVPELAEPRKKICERFLQCTQAAFDHIQKIFNLQDKTLYKKKCELTEVEEIKRMYDSLHPARIFLREQEYKDINVLNSEIEDLKNRQTVELEATQSDIREIKSSADRLEMIIREYMNLSSPETNDCAIEQLTSKLKATYQRKNARGEIYLNKLGYLNIELLCEDFTIAKKDQNEKLHRIEKKNMQLNENIARLEFIKEKHDLLLNKSDVDSPDALSSLKNRGYDSLRLLEEDIQERKKIITELEKNKQPYDFSDRLDASTANNALLYVNQCQKVGHDRVRNIAIETDGALRKYLSKYGNFRTQEINENFKQLTSKNREKDILQCSNNLEMRFRELLFLSKFEYVFDCIGGNENLTNWQQQFLDYYRTLSVQMEEYKVSCRSKELKDHLLIAQALSCLDRFCADMFAGNGFGALYKQYQVELTKECKAAYKTVLEYILRGDYANADIELTGIDDTPLNSKAIDQIKQDLQSSLNKLMKDTKSSTNWLDVKIGREPETRSQIKEIKENMEKIRIAISKSSIMEQLDEGTQKSLQDFDNEIDEKLADILKKELTAIEKLLEKDSFSEAQQSMINLNRIQYELAGLCSSDDVNIQTKKLKSELDCIIEKIQERDFSDIEKYATDSPRDLLAKLEEASYIETLAIMSKRISQNFNKAIEDVRTIPFNERPAQIKALTYALRFLPEKMQDAFKSQIEELSSLLNDQVERIKLELDRTLDGEDDSDETIKKIGALAIKYKGGKIDELYKILCTKTLSKLSVYRTNLENDLNKQDMQSAVDIMQKIYKYSQFVGAHIQDINTIYESAGTLLIKSFENCSNTLDNMLTMEQTQIIEKAYDNVVIYICFAESYGQKAEVFFPENVLQNSGDKLQKMVEYLNENSQKFQVAIREMNVTDLHKVIIVSKRWDVLLQRIKQCPIKDPLIKVSLKDGANIIAYADMIAELEKARSHLETRINTKLISDTTTKFEKERDKFFINLNKAIDTWRAINLKFKDVLPSTLNIEKELKMKIETIGADLIAQASKAELSLREIDSFRIYHNHLSSFDKHICLSGLDVQQFLKISEEKVFETIKSLRKQVVESGADALKISDILIKMKFFAENLPIFDEKMNSEIDETLKAFKQKQDCLVFEQLIMALEKNEVGARMISEHSCLSGEDWRKRREKMQYQDDLEYFLKNLTGDDIAVDVLHSRYETFSTLYYRLISDILTSFDSKKEKEPNLDVLITQTKHMMGKIIQTPGSITWDHSIRNKIPEILAHIFAVWTLKNTQHYNAVRGFEEGKKYLLMPHVVQVIAIFRLLGIGYVKSQSIVPLLNIHFNRKISNDLVNNLIEISTGEGKSVVMAVTACVFALMGVDVNCSCYSEVLSKRDMNDFASVFEAFGIENHIQYGTFNKLCEQLLNEQCDVRENVRTMIENNKTILSTAEIKAHTRPKVLLIDEVDVFLSDKFYGGTYTPSVYLKDLSIKALLDSIWKDKTLKTLNRVKDLTEYKDCATKYSNWIFLFDEAIKDMLVALQSFRSSTYIVQDDKITYVEGESLVDNTVRGYDTIWAYYYEHEQNNISQHSLENNVGLIINCGTFSYAEMPYDFAYIAGVSGTLTTLAEQEKDILKTVYGVCKNTFMPSVYGKSNRNYHPATDVHVVDQSEYFMRICGDIDAICNANRAILVFFENDEKLKVFYNASELSSKKRDVQIVSEKVSVKDRELYIKRAATTGTVTLLTRAFGRGTDFICRNPQLLAYGGIHVLQTFFSKELSEEYQIKGRGARQGDKGSYGMILLDSDLEWVLGSAWNEELQKIKGPTLYDSLNKSRNARYESMCGAKDLGIAQCRHEHQAAKYFMIALSTGNIEATKKFLSEENRGADIPIDPSRTVLLMDATGSMSSLLSAAKETVCTMFERASTVLKEKGLRSDGFQMQFVVYRNYNCDENKILQASPWSTKGSILRAFMNAIKPEGGLGEEAIEIGLAHAVKESQLPDSISQVILIGDAPANTKDQVSQKRDIFGEKYWRKTKFDQPIHYTDELERLKDEKIPVYTFYLASCAKENFEEIADKTGGRCKRLNIHSSEGAESFTHFVTKQVLRKAAREQGEAAVERYEMKYVKKTFTS